MKTYILKTIFIAFCTSLLFVQCVDDDDNGNVIEQINCNDGIQNGDETGVDCGGTACTPCLTDLDFSGTFVQEDIMGRPGINTFFSGSDLVKNNFNTTVVSERGSPNYDFQGTFEATLEAYHDIYAESMGMDPAELNYETNILGWNAQSFTSILAEFDALQVAPNGSTSYYDGTNILTGRNLSDDVVDISLVLMFGGTTGTRFDGTNDTPQLTSDGVGPGSRDFTIGFPYLELPNQ